MGTLLRNTATHIEETLGEVDAVGPWRHSSQLPFYLTDRYEFFTARVLGSECLLVLSTEDEGETPATVKKHLRTIADQFQGVVIYVAPRVTAYNRKRLIHQRVPFVVPGKQIYLPGLGLDLREQFTSSRQRRGGLGAVAQLFVLRQIYHRDADKGQLSEWAELFGYSAMTISRAIDELSANELVRVERAGRSKRLQFPGTGRELWEKAKQLMQTPVKKVTWTQDPEIRYRAPEAGESALAHYTMLAEPRYVTVAVPDREWQTIRPASELEADAIAEEAGLRIERWRYDPRLIKDGPVVDELSLWLSLQEHSDDRIAIATDQLLEQVPW